jgi:AcrR family transcriptional regulator
MTVARNTLQTAELGEGRRARTDDQKRARARAILLAAEALYLENPGALPTAAQIAARANVAKGTLYLYYTTKEEVYLALLQWRLGDWADTIIAAMRTHDGALTRESLSRAYIAYPLKHPVTLRLAALSSVVLEANVGQPAAVRFKLAQLERLRRLGLAASMITDGLEPDRATHLFLHAYAYLVGIWQLCDPPAICRQAFQTTPELAPLDLDFQAEAMLGLDAIWAVALPSETSSE